MALFTRPEIAWLPTSLMILRDDSKVILEQIYGIMGRFEGIKQDDQEYLVRELRKTTEVEVTFHKDQVNRIGIESDRIKQKSDNLLEAFLDKSITKYIYDKKYQEYYDKLQLLDIGLENIKKQTSTTKPRWLLCFL